MIIYKDNLDGITPAMLNGFCVGWAEPMDGSKLYEVLKNSYKIVLAIEDNKVIGFVNTLSDKVKFAFIPMIEVLPEYQNKGIGTKLLSTMLKNLEQIDNIDLTCDIELQTFYKKFDMLKSSGMVIRKHLNRHKDTSDR